MVVLKKGFILEYKQFQITMVSCNLSDDFEVYHTVLKIEFFNDL